MKKRLLCICLCALFVGFLCSTEASADMGPKPSIQITFEGLGDEVCYATLLSKTASTGPYSAYDGKAENAYYAEGDDASNTLLNYEIWKAFAEYKDRYYFLQTGWRVDETKTLSWTYYPPSTFKILLYFPERGAFAESGVYERYAFDSYFTVKMQGYDMTAADPAPILAEKSYDHTWEIISLLARIVFTVLLEIGIALLFGYRKRDQLAVIIGVNGATQILLNLLLNLVNYRSGYMAFAGLYVLLELAVLGIETAVFRHFLCRSTEEKRWRPVVYALVANAASFGAGFAIAKLVPGIF